MPIIWKVGLLLYEVALSIICQITPRSGITRVSYVHVSYVVHNLGEGDIAKERTSHSSNMKALK